MFLRAFLRLNRMRGLLWLNRSVKNAVHVIRSMHQLVRSAVRLPRSLLRNLDVLRRQLLHKPAKAPAPAPKEAADKQLATAQGEKSATQVPSTITVENASACPCRKLVANPLALIGIAVAVFGIFKLLKR